MKKLILGALIGLGALTATPAQSHVHFGISIGDSNSYSYRCAYPNRLAYVNTNGYNRPVCVNPYQNGYYSQYGYGYQNTYGYDYNRTQRDYDRRLREYQHQRWHQDHNWNDNDGD